MIAYMNHGRWVADCAADGCPEAHLVDNGDVFVCENCGRVDTVVFPSGWETIEQILSLRPVPQTRNWVPFESLEQLEQENIDHGLDIA